MPASSIRLDPYLVDTLLPDLVGHDRRPSAFLVYLVLWRLSDADGGAPVRVALQDLAEMTGLSKRAVQGAITRLVRRRLVRVRREGITAVGEYAVLTPWVR